jgi:hypothetical protein
VIAFGFVLFLSVYVHSIHAALTEQSADMGFAEAGIANAPLRKSFPELA